MGFAGLVPKFFRQFFGDFLMEVVVEIFEAFWVLGFEVFFTDFIGCHEVAGEELVFFEQIKAAFEILWWQNGNREKVASGFFVGEELDGEDGHGWDDIFFLFVDGWGFKNGALPGGGWRDENHAAVFDDVDGKIGIDLAEVALNAASSFVDFAVFFDAELFPGGWGDGRGDDDAKGFQAVVIAGKSFVPWQIDWEQYWLVAPKFEFDEQDAADFAETWVVKTEHEAVFGVWESGFIVNNWCNFVQIFDNASLGLFEALLGIVFVANVIKMIDGKMADFANWDHFLAEFFPAEGFEK